MPDKIIARILRETNNPNLLDMLSGLNASDLQSLLLEVYRQRAQRLMPREVLRQFEQNRFVQLAAAKPQQMIEFERLAYSLLLPEVEVIELSPVAPLGSNSVVATVDQNNAIATIRNTEVCSDCTNVMALECARRRRELSKRNLWSKERVKLCASQRLLRAQPFDAPASFAHFKVLALCTAGQEERNHQFETESLVEHIEFYVRLIEACKKRGFAVAEVNTYLTVFDEKRYEIIRIEVLEKLAAKYPPINFAFDQNRENGRGYYESAVFQIYIRDASGENYLIGDGGFTDWTQQYLSNRKERLLISGFGSERFVYVFENKES
ncbi:MAG: hypothetical protein JXM69_06020 [Anaerolineae bacterium]|nr:hypothetical protein [Anaerolineae bacterium]